MSRLFYLQSVIPPHCYLFIDIITDVYPLDDNVVYGNREFKLQSSAIY